MVNVITAATPGARNIHVMIEFLLIILTDVPKDFIHHDKLFDLLARAGALIRETTSNPPASISTAVAASAEQLVDAHVMKEKEVQVDEFA
ncbi:hypothetical protein CQW23_26627 [Capsicum baccatum]|uniref:Uncharacterized protein n=1 Tax=Capsicum baccatum TaxID=33114 RepID=A0A2G2VPB9_CAPBA|nr:hypothetical protein CQW23_26627 [Capsicum baccatum]